MRPRYCYRDTEGDVQRFESETEMVKAILAGFAETGQNPVEECWLEPEGQGEDGEEVSLSLQWSLKVIY